MSDGFVLDAGVLQGLAKEEPPNAPITYFLREQEVPLVTIKEVAAECLDVPVRTLDTMRIIIQSGRIPPGPESLLDAFSGGSRSVWWSIDPLPRADRAVVGHAIAMGYDILTTDRRMKERSFREFLTRLDRMADSRLPPWYIPEIIVVQRGVAH